MISDLPDHLHCGEQGVYRWVTSSAHTINHLLAFFPQLVMHKYLAVTSCDSAPLRLIEVDEKAGWHNQGGIAYSPQISSRDLLPPRALYDEWYVFFSPEDTERLNILGSTIGVFVNCGFFLEGGELAEAARRFWEQIGQVRPFAYVAECDYGYLTFVTGDTELFEAVWERLCAPARRAL